MEQDKKTGQEKVGEVEGGLGRLLCGLLMPAWTGWTTCVWWHGTWGSSIHTASIYMRACSVMFRVSPLLSFLSSLCLCLVLSIFHSPPSLALAGSTWEEEERKDLEPCVEDRGQDRHDGDGAWLPGWHVCCVYALHDMARGNLSLQGSTYTFCPFPPHSFSHCWPAAADMTLQPSSLLYSSPCRTQAVAIPLVTSLLLSLLSLSLSLSVLVSAFFYLLCPGTFLPTIAILLCLVAYLCVTDFCKHDWRLRHYSTLHETGTVFAVA